MDEWQRRKKFAKLWNIWLRFEKYIPRAFAERLSGRVAERKKLQNFGISGLVLKFRHF